MSEKEREEFFCPICFFMRCLSAKQKKYEKFFEHLRKARIEVLEAFKSLIDERIAELQKKEKKKVEKIKVEG